jgi:thiosulfate/3-mercaptopyruvate sulfurtransferase
MNPQELLVSPSWLSQHLDDPSIRVLDASVVLGVDPETGQPRAESGRPQWLQSHIPGSAFADLLGLSDPNEPGPYKLPSAEGFAEGMGRLGVGSDTRVVAYASGTATWATRLWWMLRVFGHDKASVLDGGWQAWTQANLPVTQEESVYPPAVFKARVCPELLARLDQVEAYVQDGGKCLVNALSAEMHRAGRIPGSFNVPYDLLLDSSGRFLPPDRIEAEFKQHGLLEPDKPLVTYCGGGVAATVDAFALALTGRQVAVYDGSLMEWAADPERPVQTG